MTFVVRHELDGALFGVEYGHGRSFGGDLRQRGRGSVAWERIQASRAEL